nr:hypothetical protein [Tanacetum cinerariifolium]
MEIGLKSKGGGWVGSKHTVKTMPGYANFLKYGFYGKLLVTNSIKFSRLAAIRFRSTGTPILVVAADVS